MLESQQSLFVYLIDEIELFRQAIGTSGTKINAPPIQWQLQTSPVANRVPGVAVASPITTGVQTSPQSTPIAKPARSPSPTPRKVEEKEEKKSPIVEVAVEEPRPSALAVVSPANSNPAFSPDTVSSSSSSSSSITSSPSASSIISPRSPISSPVKPPPPPVNTDTFAHLPRDERLRRVLMLRSLKDYVPLPDMPYIFSRYPHVLEDLWTSSEEIASRIDNITVDEWNELQLLLSDVEHQLIVSNIESEVKDIMEHYFELPPLYYELMEQLNRREARLPKWNALLEAHEEKLRKEEEEFEERERMRHLDELKRKRLEEKRIEAEHELEAQRREVLDAEKRAMNAPAIAATMWHANNNPSSYTSTETNTTIQPTIVNDISPTSQPSTTLPSFKPSPSPISASIGQSVYSPSSSTHEDVNNLILPSSNQIEGADDPKFTVSGYGGSDEYGTEIDTSPRNATANIPNFNVAPYMPAPNASSYRHPNKSPISVIRPEGWQTPHPTSANRPPIAASPSLTSTNFYSSQSTNVPPTPYATTPADYDTWQAKQRQKEILLSNERQYQSHLTVPTPTAHSLQPSPMSTRGVVSNYHPSSSSYSSSISPSSSYSSQSHLTQSYANRSISSVMAASQQNNAANHSSVGLGGLHNIIEGDDSALQTTTSSLPTQIQQVRVGGNNIASTSSYHQPDTSLNELELEAKHNDSFTFSASPRNEIDEEFEQLMSPKGSPPPAVAVPSYASRAPSKIVTVGIGSNGLKAGVSAPGGFLVAPSPFALQTPSSTSPSTLGFTPKMENWTPASLRRSTSQPTNLPTPTYNNNNNNNTAVTSTIPTMTSSHSASIGGTTYTFNPVSVQIARHAVIQEEEVEEETHHDEEQITALTHTQRMQLAAEELARKEREQWEREQKEKIAAQRAEEEEVLGVTSSARSHNDARPTHAITTTLVPPSHTADTSFTAASRSARINDSVEEVITLEDDHHRKLSAISTNTVRDISPTSIISQPGAIASANALLSSSPPAVDTDAVVAASARVTRTNDVAPSNAFTITLTEPSANANVQQFAASGTEVRPFTQSLSNTYSASLSASNQVQPFAASISTSSLPAPLQAFGSPAPITTATTTASLTIPISTSEPTFLSAPDDVDDEFPDYNESDTYKIDADTAKRLNQFTLPTTATSTPAVISTTAPTVRSLPTVHSSDDEASVANSEDEEEVYGRPKKKSDLAVIEKGSVKSRAAALVRKPKPV